MKKVFLFIAVFAMSFLNAQNIQDALTYSDQNILGTARYRAIGGAFGALGGDLSAVQVNPAGSAIFLNTAGSMTLSSSGLNNLSDYFGAISEEYSRNVNFNQLGGVFVYNNVDETSVFNRLSLGLLYDQTADNFDQQFVSGRSNNSVESYFRTEAQGIPLELITVAAGETIDGVYSFLGEEEGFSAQQAFLGHEAFVIEADDPDDPGNTSYTSNVAPGVFDQEYRYETTGLNGKFTINGGAQIHKNFYVGANLSSHFINYDRFTEFYESNNNTGSSVSEIIFENRLSTTGAGVSAQIGGIAKLSGILRVGVSIESPTWYIISEETTQRLETVREPNQNTILQPDIINVFPDYQLRTPAKTTGSIALLLGKRGFISLDYSYKDYGTIEFSSDEGVDFTSLNEEIENTLQGVSIIRIGGEWRDGNWSYRAGFNYEESPYIDDLIRGEKTGFSAGFGYTFNRMKLDFAYDTVEQESTQQFYPGSGFNNRAFINSRRDNITVTLGISL